MSAKDRLCTHCGTFIADDDAVRPCIEGGYAHAGCEHVNEGGWHDRVETDCCEVPRREDETFVVLDSNGDPDVRVCRRGMGCHEEVTPTPEDYRDLDRIIQDEEAEVEDHR